MQKILRYKHYIRQKVRQVKYGKVFYMISFPKSGRTWIELMFAKLYSELTGYGVSEILNYKVRKLKNKSSGKKIPKLIFGHGFLNSEICMGNFFPGRFYKNKNVIYLARDPRDIIISLYYYDKYKYGNFDKSLTDFIHFDNSNAYNIMSKRYGIKPIINHMNAFIEHSLSFKSFKVMYYEDFKNNARQMMKELSGHTVNNISDNMSDTVINYGHIENMRKLEKDNELNWYALQGSGKASKVRKGKTGGYKSELSEENISFLNNYIREHLNPFYNRYIF